MRLICTRFHCLVQWMDFDYWFCLFTSSTLPRWVGTQQTQLSREKHKPALLVESAANFWSSRDTRVQHAVGQSAAWIIVTSMALVPQRMWHQLFVWVTSVIHQHGLCVRQFFKIFFPFLPEMGAVGCDWFSVVIMSWWVGWSVNLVGRESAEGGRKLCPLRTCLYTKPYLFSFVPKSNFPYTIQYNLIAKCQYNCTGMFCGAKYTHHTFTPIIKHHYITTTSNKHPGKNSFINKYMRNPTDTSCVYHIKIASSQGPPLKITVVIKGIMKIIYSIYIYIQRERVWNIFNSLFSADVPSSSRIPQ